MPQTTADVAWVDVLPSPKNFLPTLRGITSAAARTAGAEAGTLFANQMADAVAAASGRLKAAQKAQADALGGLSVAQARLNDLQQTGGVSAGRLAAAEEAVAKAQRNLQLQTEKASLAQDVLTRNQAASVKAAEASVVKHDLLSGSMGRLSGVAGGLTGALGSVNKAYGLMFAAMTLALPVLPFVAAARDAGNFQAALVKLVTTAGETNRNITEVIGPGLLKMSTQVGVGANDMAKAMYTVESAGFHGAEGLEVMRAAAEGARQENADLGKVVDAVTTILHDYHLPASEAADVTSKLIEAVSHGKVTFEQMTGALHSVTPLAAALGVPLEDIASALAAMTASGESAEQATENMRNALLSLQKPSAQQRAELEQLGISATDLADSLSTRGLTGTMQLVSRTILEHMGPSGRLLLDALNESTTAATDMRHEIDAMPPSLKTLSQNLLDGKVSVGEYRKEVLAMGGTAGAQGLQFLQLYRTSDGFNQILRTGRPDVQTYTQALQNAVGTTAGLTVALQLTGENGEAVNRTIQDVANAAAQADGNIKGWSEVQGTFNQKLAEAKASVEVLAIKIGQALIPSLGSFLGVVADHIVPTMASWISQVGDFVHSSGFQDFLHGLTDAVGGLLGVVKNLVTSFASSGGLQDLMLGIGAAVKIAAGAFEGLANVTTAVLTPLVHAFAALPAPVQAVVVAFAALRVAAAAGLFEGLINAGGRLLSFFGTLKTAVGVAGLEIGAAFSQASSSRQFITSMEGSSVAAGKFTGAISGLGAAAGAAAKGGLSALKSAGSGLVSLFGGPWGVALAAAGVGLALMISAVQHHNQAVEKATQDVTAWYKAIAEGGQGAVDAQAKLIAKGHELAEAQAKLKELEDALAVAQENGHAVTGRATDAISRQKAVVAELSGEVDKGTTAYKKWWDSLGPVQQATSTLNQAENNLALAIQQHGAASSQAQIAAGQYQTALEQQKQVTDQLNESEKTTVQRLDEIAQRQLTAVSSSLGFASQQLALKQAIDQTNQGMADGTLTGDALAQSQLQLAQQIISVATAAGQAAVDQATANGVTDTAAVKNQAMLDVLRAYADQITGPGHDAIEAAITDLASFQTGVEQATGTAAAGTGVAGATAAIGTPTSDGLIHGLTGLNDLLGAAGLQQTLGEFAGAVGAPGTGVTSKLQDLNTILGQAGLQQTLDQWGVALSSFNTQISGPTTTTLNSFTTQLNGPVQTSLASFSTELSGPVVNSMGTVSSTILGPLAAALGSLITTSGVTKDSVSTSFATAAANIIAQLGSVQQNIYGPTNAALASFAATSVATTGVVNASFNGMRDNTVAALGVVQGDLNGPTTTTLAAFATTTSTDNSIVNASFNAMRDNTVARLTDVQNNLNGPTASSLATLVSNVNSTSTQVQGSFVAMTSGVIGSAATAARGVSLAYDQIRAGVANPVNFVSQNVLGGGLIPAFNNVAAAVGIAAIHPALPVVTVGSTPLSAASGGQIPGPYMGPTADNVLGYIPMAGGGQTPIRVNPREWIQPVHSVDYYGSDVMAALQTRRIDRGALDMALAMSRAPGMAGGGLVTASGPDRGNYVVQPDIAGRTRHFLDALNAGQAEAVQAAGGFYAQPRFFWGGYADPISAAKAFATAQNGKPYIWGGVGPAGFDCSGFQSAITNVLRGSTNPYSRVGSTDTFPWKGFSPGLGGSYAIGAYHGNPGHMAGTVAGINAEAGGPHNNVAFGGPAVGADASEFNIQAFLPQIGGVFVSGGGGGVPAGITIDGTLMTDPSQVLGYLKASVDGRLAAMTATYGNNFVTQLGAGTVNTLVQGVYDHIQASVAAAMAATAAGTVGTVPASGDIKSVVQAQAAPYGWSTGTEWADIDQIISHESGWNPTIQNPTSTASGLGQFINSTWLAYRGSSTAPTMKQASVADQGAAIMRYIKAVYGDPIGAWAFWQAHSYYGKGGQALPDPAGAKAGRFDDGGLWPDRWIGVNTTHGTERVLTPPQDQYFQRFVKVTEGLRRRRHTDGSGQVIGQYHQHFHGDERAHDAMDDLWHRVKVYSRGGVYAGAGASTTAETFLLDG